MTDWEQITVDIQRAMQAVDDLHLASKALREQPTPDRVDVFQRRMRELSGELQRMQYIMSHEEDVFADEVADALSEIFYGRPAPWRKTPRHLEMEGEAEKS